jgi:hypothetical protein
MAWSPRADEPSHSITEITVQLKFGAILKLFLDKEKPARISGLFHLDEATSL